LGNNTYVITDGKNRFEFTLNEDGYIHGRESIIIDNGNNTRSIFNMKMGDYARDKVFLTIYVTGTCYFKVTLCYIYSFVTEDGYIETEYDVFTRSWYFDYYERSEMKEAADERDSDLRNITRKKCVKRGWDRVENTLFLDRILIQIYDLMAGASSGSIPRM
jgi:hypothetical protein